MIEVGCVEVVGRCFSLVGFEVLCFCVFVAVFMGETERTLPETSQSPFSTEGPVKLPL